MKFIISVCIIFMLVSCSEESYISETVSNFTEERPIEEVYDVYKEVARYNMSKVEPYDSIYLGANINNSRYENDINMFQEAVGKKHAVYVKEIYSTTSDKEIENFIFKNISNESIPYFIINFTNKDGDLSVENYRRIIGTMGKINHPIFVEVLPFPAKNKIESKKYTDFMIKMYDEIQLAGQNLNMVYPLDSEYSVLSYEYFAGNKYTDYVSIYMMSDTNDMYTDVLLSMEYLYNNLIETPIFLNVGVGHYSKEGHEYNIDTAIDKIEHIYTDVHEYSNIVGINYFDIDYSKTKITTTENYSVTRIDEILTEYKQLIKNEKFINIIVNNINGKRKIDMPYIGIKYDDELYISATILDSHYYKEYSKKIEDSYYISLKQLEKILKENKFIIDEQNKRIIIK